MVHEERHNVWFTAVARILHCEDKMEAWDENQVTLYRFGLEFIHPLNPLVIESVRSRYSGCYDCGGPLASITDTDHPDRNYCVLCHLRKACHNLLVDRLEGA